MRIIMGADHGGFELKQAIIEYLAEKNYEVENLGTDSKDSFDYPDYAKLVGEKVASNEDSLGILICGTGVGMSIAANKIPGIRAAFTYFSKQV